MTKISFYTFGCRTNQSETASIQKSFEDIGYSVVDIKNPADIAIINTCTVTAKGDADTRKLVNKLSKINPKIKIALIGCQSETQKETLLQLKNVKWVVGTASKMKIASIIVKDQKKDTPTVLIPEISTDPFKIKSVATNTKQTRANLKIQDGCNFFCSYCEVPYARGRTRSRIFEDILKEAKILAKAGYKEVVITGINVGTYNFENKKITDVIEALEQIDEIKRIRISSIEPGTIPSKLLKIMKRDSKLCRYLHIPLQSGSDKILKLMNRKYSFNEFEKFILHAHKEIPNVCIGSDVIVGFPGETESNFSTTYKRIKNLPLNYLHVFSYSKRTLAKSKNFPNPVQDNIISERSKKLRVLSLQKRQNFFKSKLGSVQKVLFEQKKGGDWTGLTDNYIRVKAPSSKNIANSFLFVKLDKIDGQTVRGTITNTQTT